MFPALNFPVMLAASGTDYQTVIEALTTDFTEANIASILAYGVGAAAGFVLFWFGVKKVSGLFIRAMKRGKIRI